MKQPKPYRNYCGHCPGTWPLPMGLGTRADRARRRRQRGHRYRWLYREPQPLGGSSGRGG